MPVTNTTTALSPAIERTRGIARRVAKLHGQGAGAVGRSPFARSLDHLGMEAKPQIVVAGEVDIGLAGHLDGPRVQDLELDQLAAQALAAAALEKGPVPAFARSHDPVLAGERHFS